MLCLIKVVAAVILSATAVALLLFVVASLFTWSGSYHKEYERSDSPLDSDYDFVIQVDDHGNLWNRNEAEIALKRIREESANTNAIVVIYIHGWHHNASADDIDLAQFSTSLEVTRWRLLTQTYAQSREILTGKSDVKVYGIYVGWRGRAVWGWLDYFTFWNRKAAAERVGSGELKNFLIELQDIYDDRNSSNSNDARRPFMGLVAFGHSFGGQVLFKAVGEMFESELSEAVTLSTLGENAQLRKPIEGFGDVSILINPAFEAAQYERIHQLASKIDFNFKQPPVLVVVSAKQDYARSFFFPRGREIAYFLTAVFRKLGPRELWTRALGEYPPQVTHDLRELAKSERRPPFDPVAYGNNRCDLVKLDLTDDPAFVAYSLQRRDGKGAPHNPFVVAYADSAVTRGHVEQFKSKLRAFLNDYVAIVEGKRMLLREPEMKECP